MASPPLTGLQLWLQADLGVFSDPPGVVAVQKNLRVITTSVSAIGQTFASGQTAGNCNVVSIGWGNATTNAITSVVDTKGNTYSLAIGPSGLVTRAFYVASNIVSAAGGSNTVSVNFTTTSPFTQIFILEYSGTTGVLDGAGISASGTGTALDTGGYTTLNANDLLVCAQWGGSVGITVSAGLAFIIESDCNFSSPAANSTIEDRNVTATGTYHGTFTYGTSQTWAVQMIALKAKSPYPSSSNPAVTCDPVANWVDQSGNGNSVIQPNLISRPDYLNIRSSSLDFIDYPTWLQTPWLQITGNAPRHMCVCFSIYLAQNSELISWGTVSVGSLSQLGIFGTGIGFLGDANDLTVPYAPYNDGKFHIMQLDYDGTTRHLYIDNALVATDTPTALTTGSSDLTIGAAVNGSNFFIGRIQSAFVYNVSLNTANQQALYSYALNNVGFIPQTPTVAPTDPIALPRIILDSSLSSDWGSIDALAVLHHFQNIGACKLIGVTVNSANIYSAPATQALNNWYFHGDIPVGSYQGGDVPGGAAFSASQYTQQVATRFRPAGETRSNYPSALTVLRTLLAAAVPNSVTIMIAGYAQNLVALMNSGPDSISPLTGMQLINQAVNRLCVMGGKTSGAAFIENNMQGDPVSAAFMMSNWPTCNVDHGFEVGATVTVAPLSTRNPLTDPSYYAWTLWTAFTHQPTNRAWDELVAMYCTFGLSTNFSWLNQSGIEIVTRNVNNAQCYYRNYSGNTSAVSKVISDAAFGVLIGQASGGGYINAPPTVDVVLTPPSIREVSQSAGVLNGVVVNTNGATITGAGFRYGTTSSYGSWLWANGSFSTFTQTIPGAVLGQKYYFQAAVNSSQGIAFGQGSSFTYTVAPGTGYFVVLTIESSYLVDYLTAGVDYSQSIETIESGPYPDSGVAFQALWTLLNPPPPLAHPLPIPPPGPWT